ncbi:MAG: hypothetical protein CMG57_01885 [Candidatus Marinimicrobia bacterium]|nr:hypothetical protein [Candidatus Neomarinimicrobiota bacterium]
MQKFMAINDDFIKVFTLVFDITPDKINIDLTQNDVMKWDSLSQMHLIVALEEAFNIKLELEEIVTMNSVKAISDVLMKKGVNIIC